MKKLIALFLTLCMLCLLFASCGRDSASDSYNSASKVESSTGTAYEEVAKDEAEIDDARKIIKTYNLSLETKNFEEDSRFIVSEAEALGGYVADSSVTGNSISSDSSRTQSARYTIRVPAKSLETYIASVSEICNVYSSSLTTEDITDSYYGIQSQLDSLVIQEQKLTEMLAEAKTLQDMITLDDKLTSVRSEINALNYRLQSMDKSVNYSYVYITLNEVREYHVEEKTYLQELGEAIVGSMENFVDVIGNLIIVVVWVFPFGFVIAGIILAVVLLERHSRKKKAKKQNLDSDQKKNP
ncbi:MAG: DUF4349 domain-containing protein [Clostridia bacterium]|nr:DUF4349 domain-containing protein [Clostridia bacterium]